MQFHRLFTLYLLVQRRKNCTSLCNTNILDKVIKIGNAFLKLYLFCVYRQYKNIK